MCCLWSAHHCGLMYTVSEHTLYGRQAGLRESLGLSSNAIVDKSLHLSLPLFLICKREVTMGVSTQGCCKNKVSVCIQQQLELFRVDDCLSILTHCVRCWEVILGRWADVERWYWVDGQMDNLVSYAVVKNAFLGREQLRTVRQCWQRCSSTHRGNRYTLVLLPNPALPQWHSSQIPQCQWEQPW